jgi:hypothetical protein
MLEKKEELVNVFDRIIKDIEKEIKTFDVIIDDLKLFSLNDIIDKLTTQNKDIYLTPMDVRNIFTYKEFDKNIKLDEKSKKELDEAKKKQDNELDEIKFKSFENLLNKNNTENNNAELFYKIKKKILDDCNKDEIKYLEENINESILKPGLYFIKIQKELNIVEKREGLLTKYSIKIIDMGNEFIIHIQGSIKIDEQEKTFRIYEKYANQKFGQIINAYKIKPLIEIFDGLFIEKYRNEKDTIKNDKIQDYLLGKIKR